MQTEGLYIKEIFPLNDWILDIEKQNCINFIKNNVVPKFVQFFVSDKDIHNSLTYRESKIKLPKQ